LFLRKLSKDHVIILEAHAFAEAVTGVGIGVNSVGFANSERKRPTKEKGRTGSVGGG
jgi:hypothetical protein